MTTVAARGRVMAADSMESCEASGLALSAAKLYRHKITTPRGAKQTVLIGLSGESYSGLVFLDWYPGAAWLLGRRGKLPPQFGDESAAFEALILEPGGLYTCDRFCRPMLHPGPFTAIGSGAKAALAALEMGADAMRAVEIACKYDIHSRLPVVAERI